MALPGNLTLSEDALDSLAHGHGIGQPHILLRPEPLWRNDAERAELNRALAAELGHLPIYEGHGKLDRDFEDSLRCLCRPEIAYVAMTNVQDRFRHLLACSLGREAILAVHEHERVMLRQISPNALAQELIAALPNHPPAKFQPFSVPYAEDEQTQQTEQGFMRSANARTVSRERQQWDQLVAHPAYGGGQITVELRDELGRSSETEDPFMFVDADLGRWYRSTEHRGNMRYVFCAPLPRETFVQRLHALQEQLRGAAR